MRDRQMRDSYLEVGRYPYAAFGGTIEQVVSLPGEMFQVTTQGHTGDPWYRKGADIDLQFGYGK